MEAAAVQGVAEDLPLDAGHDPAQLIRQQGVAGPAGKDLPFKKIPAVDVQHSLGRLLQIALQQGEALPGGHLLQGLVQENHLVHQ